MIDTHSHLFDEAFTNDLEACIQRCYDNNVNKVILVGFSKQTNQQAIDFASKYPLFYPTAGLHPSEASIHWQEDMLYLADFIAKHKVYAIGECGLDYHYGKDDYELQKELFIAQIKLSIEQHLPLIIHMRDATQDTYDILKQFKGQAYGVMHCYSGSWEMAKEFMKLGFKISLGGPVTFKNAKESKIVAKEIDLSQLLIETDCPYLAPVPFRGTRNESSYVHYVCEEIARIKSMDAEIVAKQTEQNAIALFRLEESK